MEPTLQLAHPVKVCLSLAPKSAVSRARHVESVDRDALNDLIVGTSSRQRLDGGEHHEETDRRRRETPDDSIERPL